MSKTKTAFFCQNCGSRSSKWMGKCTSCGEWNTYIEEVIVRETKSNLLLEDPRNTVPQKISEVEMKDLVRIPSGNSELDRVLGGGIVPGSVVLIGGEPGIGKSTLMLQVALKIPTQKTLYVSGEENAGQIKMRAERIGISNDDCYIFTETDTHLISNCIKEVKPGLLIIDSVQTLSCPEIDSIPGSVSQIRESTAEIQKIAKKMLLPTFLIGHITKDGNLAGPKLLEHIVDTVLQFEGDRNHIYRILRATKNRFGSTSEIGIYEMQQNGLREVTNPSEILISQHEESLSGIAIAVTLEGQRVLLIEAQALVSSAVYGTPQRSSTGFDNRRLNMLLAVLEKRAGFKLGIKDVFLNIAGGLRVDDPAIDLAVVAAILSSNADIPIPNDICFCAEVGLSGEIRPVARIEQRISEAVKLGFKKIIVSKYNTKGLSKHFKDIHIKPCHKLEEVVVEVFS